ncbi:hypothetical protein V6N13_012511 [Hibiscus sabdariffa]
MRVGYAHCSHLEIRQWPASQPASGSRRFKPYSDASVVIGDLSATVGGFIRDAHGRWVVGYSKQNISCVLVAELLAMEQRQCHPAVTGLSEYGVPSGSCCLYQCKGIGKSCLSILHEKAIWWPT